MPTRSLETEAVIDERIIGPFVCVEELFRFVVLFHATLFLPLMRQSIKHIVWHQT